MIGLTRLKRAIADVPTGGMQTGDPKVRLKLCDAQRIEVEFNAIIAERDAALAQVEQLKGIKPELPPRPPQGEGLPRYGINWNGPEQPLTVPMDDGYWTPYHLAAAQNAELADDVEGLTHWRRLALQFDGHRMQAMCMLKLVASGQFDIEEVRKFVAAAPACGDEHLRDLKANSYKTGWLDGYKQEDCFINPELEAVAAANKHAARVKVGE